MTQEGALFLLKGLEEQESVSVLEVLDLKVSFTRNVLWKKTPK